MGKLTEIRQVALANAKDIVQQKKEMVESTYDLMMRLEYIARREGLLALEYEAYFIPKDVPMCQQLTKMIELVCSGTDPELFEEFVTCTFLLNRYEGIDALLYFLYARCMLMIQAATSPLDMEEFFNSIVSGSEMVFHKRRDLFTEGEETTEKRHGELSKEEAAYLLEFSKRLPMLSKEEWNILVSRNGFCGWDKVLPYLDEEAQELVKQYMNEYRYYVIMKTRNTLSVEELGELVEEFKNFVGWLRGEQQSGFQAKGILDGILRCSDEEIKLLLTKIDTLTLAAALNGVSEEVANCFYRNISFRLRFFLQEEMEYLGPLRMSEVEAAQKKIYQIWVSIQ